jgi:hypothetical protein
MRQYFLIILIRFSDYFELIRQRLADIIGQPVGGLCRLIRTGQLYCYRREGHKFPDRQGFCSVLEQNPQFPGVISITLWQTRSLIGFS